MAGLRGRTIRTLRLPALHRRTMSAPEGLSPISGPSFQPASLGGASWRRRFGRQLVAEG